MDIASAKKYALTIKCGSEERLAEECDRSDFEE
jgi:hypothetical protein